MPRNPLTTEQVAARLGIKVETVYAYVSRGVLSRTLADDGRTSRFDPTEVEELARRGRPRQGRRRRGAVEVTLATSITRLGERSIRYRGHDVADLAAHSTFESVAELLWSGVLPTATDPQDWALPDDATAVVGALGGALPASATATDRLAAVTVGLGAADPLRVDRRPAAVTRAGRHLLAGFARVLPEVPPGARTRRRTGRSGSAARPDPRIGARRRIAATLWPRLSPMPLTRPRVRVLDAALVLLADHELATSTLAVRVAASTRSDPYAAVLAGLGALAGPRHGAAGASAHRLLLDAVAGSPEVAVATALASGGGLPGFGHPLYRDGDPRAPVLLDRVRAICPRPLAAVVDAVVAHAPRADAGRPNIDLALAALAVAADMPVGATDAVFATARTAGWVAHALEEYGEAPLRFRARAVYTGA